MNNAITPVLLAGGSGTRLWPLSRKSYPKQFSKIIGDTSLFQQTAMRLISSNHVEFNPHITLTNTDFRFIVGEQMHAVGISPGPILIEPASRNTAPAILAASIFTSRTDPDAILLVAPSDHVIHDVEAFHKALSLGLTAVSKGKIVTFGVTPDRPETGYGYLKLSNHTDNGTVDVVQFIEKPCTTRADQMLAAGNFLWNAGIFMFRARDMIKSFETHSAALIEPVQSALSASESDLDFERIEPKAWSRCEDVSIDYAVMEKANNLVAIPFTAGWSDLGGWNAVMTEMNTNTRGVATSNNTHEINCTNTLLRSENETLELVGIGLKDIIAVAMPDAVLVANKNNAQDVGKLIKMLKSKNIPQAENFSKDHRPWGWFETLAIRGRFQVKQIFVKAGEALSLQSHHHRSEHWIVVEGTAKVTIGDEVRIVSEGQSVYIPLGSKHRLENPGKISMHLIEVQTGTYLGEDDIIRYEDRYSRS